MDLAQDSVGIACSGSPVTMSGDLKSARYEGILAN
jgi:hypothetical protein